MSRRRLEALRQLAERPGTEHEGKVARAALERLEAKQAPVEGVYAKFKDFLRTGSMDDLADAIGPRTCACGSQYPAFTKCTNEAEHAYIRRLIPKLFPRGMRVYYNRWAYEHNCVGTVVGYPVKPFDGSWAWIRIKFDHLKQARSVPIYSAAGWHLSMQPVSRDEFVRLGGLDI